jgi:hypothetical protein
LVICIHIFLLLFLSYEVMNFTVAEWEAYRLIKCNRMVKGPSGASGA